MQEPYPESIHVEVHHENGEYWAQVKEWPGCFASGRTLGELTEALEDNVALYLAPDPAPGDKKQDPQPVEPVQLHILEMELRLGANRPLNPAEDDESDEPLPSLPRIRDPHARWALRDFHRRGENG